MTRLTREECMAISAVVHQNYYMPDVFAAVEKIIDARQNPEPQIGPLRGASFESIASMFRSNQA